MCKDAEAMCVLESNPGLQNMFMKMIKAGIQEGIKETTASLQGGATKSGELSGKNSNSKGNNTKSKSNSTNFVESPSDTTLYTPALQRVMENKRVEDMINKISNFVEEIRIQSAQQIEPRDRRPPAGASRMVKCKLNMEEDDDIQPGTSGMIEPSPKQVSDKFILEAEHFRENVEPPVKGMYDTLDNDNYFHLACHVDENLKEKIEHGEFIDLEKLLPKQRPHKSGGERLERVSKDGMTYLAPAQDRENHISNIRKWDQAFRVYAAIYCDANPGRAGEIWQYIYVIHSAASTFQWDNVAYYDFTFRQMMHNRPNRKWNKTYIQLWQLAMQDPIVKSTRAANNNFQSGKNFSGFESSNSNLTNQTQKRHRSWKDNCCWKFNRTGKCDRINCSFDNRCSFCDAWNSHGFNTCKKRDGDKGDKTSSRK